MDVCVAGQARQKLIKWLELQLVWSLVNGIATGVRKPRVVNAVEIGDLDALLAVCITGPAITAGRIDGIVATIAGVARRRVDC